MSSTEQKNLEKYQDFTSLKNLPDAYKWTAQNIDKDDKVTKRCIETEMIVPIIDLNDPNVVDLIGHASKTSGMFQIINHGIPTSLFDDIEYLNTTFFSLPIEQKVKVVRKPEDLTGYGNSRIGSHFSKNMWAEGFTIGGPTMKQFGKLWPDDHTKYSEIIENYTKEMRKLAERMVWLMFNAIGVTKEDFELDNSKSDLENATSFLQLNYYPVCPDPSEAMGLAEHRDSNFITILYQSNVSGLQVKTEELGWATVNPHPGALVINVGELFQLITNGVYTSMLHRALVNGISPRQSVAYLYGPPLNVVLSPLPKLVTPTQPLVYKSITSADFIVIKDQFFNKTMESLEIK